ncbi:UDP-N-acetylmuramoyl-tripeptide--D-alanyl-D-alanine ligase [uncultured Eubacterium sp.]|uniref:UDP-N-acetylmuramoyl-tripeptide--D-alanyl-D- alanine ligase n=1 Tax=uncultured Eubacterium sp. TaxID=165185 RepID=UPI002671963B|nr:UDP-N-acetylmuramoyl-tripeptide--D-alanyl-D-alanine ligase [uncultured Eubacterium sp.]
MGLKNMTLSNIAKACNGVYFGDENLKEKEITGVEKDSRLIKEGFLYLPFVGARVDGHDFIPQVFEKGASCTLSEKDLENVCGPYIKVDSVAEALKDIAEFYREQLSCKIIGITGSVGKTSTKEIIASVLSEKYQVLKTEGNYNNEIGMPLTILKIRNYHEIAVIEMGISDFEEMHRLAKVSKPDVCVITNIGTCHLENLGDRDGVFRAKTEIFDYAKEDCFVVLNGDDDKLIQIHQVKGKSPLFFGIHSRQDISIITYKENGVLGTEVEIKYFDDILKTVIPIPGFHMLYNVMAATCIGVHFDMTLEEVDRGIRKLKAINGRNNIFTAHGITVIDDCYNANPMSMKASLNVLSKAQGRKVAVLGDMFELGKNEVELHAQVGEEAAKLGIDLVICIGNLSRNIAEAAKRGSGHVLHFAHKEDFMTKIEDYIKEGDTVLIKASNGMKFSTIVTKLKEKTLS